jgi:hypothetical protein
MLLMSKESTLMRDVAIFQSWGVGLVGVTLPIYGSILSYFGTTNTPMGDGRFQYAFEGYSAIFWGYCNGFAVLALILFLFARWVKNCDAVATPLL